MEIYFKVGEEYYKAFKNILQAYYEVFVGMNHPENHTIKNTIKEDKVTMWDSIDLYNSKEYPIESINYRFISQLSRSKIK